jgi:peptidoglycan/xylan/chitin deacetylase (PgdA/CDA1 family)
MNTEVSDPLNTDRNNKYYWLLPNSGRVCLCLALLALLTMSATAGWAKGMVTFSFDDGLSSVYIEAFPILKKYQLKATTGVVYNRIISGNDDYMDVANVLELQRNGWEVASHGYTHKRPTEIPSYFYEEPLTGWEPDERLPDVYEIKYPYSLIAELWEDGTPLQSVNSLKEVAKTPGSYYHDTLIGSLHVHTYSLESPKHLDIRSISYQRELAESRKGLESLGFKVTTYVTPYNYWTPEMRELCKYYYEQAANGGESANFKGTIDRFWLKRYFIHTLGPADEVAKLLKKNVIDKDGWVILCFHGIEDETGWQPWSAENLEQLAAWIVQENIKVVTIAEGTEIMERSFLKSLFE